MEPNKALESVAAERRLQRTDYFRPGRHIEVRHQTTVDFPVHFHSYFELEIIVDGDAIHLLNGEAYDIARGSVYLLTPTDYHRVIPRNGMVTLRNLIFDEHVLSEERLRQLTAGALRTPFRLSEAALLRVDALVSLLYDEAEHEGEDTCADVLLEALLRLLLRDAPPTHPTAAEHGPDEIQRALFYLQTHFREAPSLAEVAQTVGFHPAYFSEKLRAVTGMTFSSHLNTLRCDYAKRLLAQGMSVAEAAFGAGFGSLSSFQHTFKRNTGHTPSAYRRNHVTSQRRSAVCVNRFNKKHIFS